MKQVDLSGFVNISGYRLVNVSILKSGWTVIQNI